MRRDFALLLSVAVASITPVNAQQAPQAGTPRFQTGTRMVLIPVAVRDREGHTVADLTRDSFQLFDKGKEQPITSFSVERSDAAGSAGAAASATPPSQFLVYFFDDVSLHDFGTVMPIREAALHELANLQPGDRAAVFSSSCRLAQDFTDDRTKLQEVISKLEPNPIRICRVAPTLPLQITLLEAVVQRMTHLPGAKRVVVISAGFAVNRDEQTMREALIDQAAEAKVTIDSLHIVENTGAQSGVPGSTNRSPGFGNSTTPATDNREVNSENLSIVADGTGGTVVEAGNKPDAGLRALATPDCVYMLGFVPTEKADGTYHKLKVTLKDSRKLNVRARAGYYATETAGAPVTAAAAPPEEPEKRVTAGAVSPPSKPAPATQTAVNAPERIASAGPVSFRARTNLVQVPVVVRDKNGNPVGDLHKGDFQLSDRGQKQEIANFSEEKLERPPATATASPRAAEPAANAAAAEAKAPSNVIPGRFTAYIFDDVHMRRGDLSQVREAVWRNMRESASPSERIAIFTTSRRVFTDFTDDLDKLHTALYKINSTAMFRSVCTECGDLSFYLGYQVVKGNTLAMQFASGQVRTPAQQIAAGSAPTGRGGSANSGLAQPGSPAGNAGMDAEVAAVHAVRAGEQETELSLDALRDVARRMVSLAGRRIIVMLSQGVFIPDEQQGELERTIDWALRSGVVINTLNTVGLDPGAIGLPPGSPTGPGTPPTIDLSATSPSEDDTIEPSGKSTPYTSPARLAEQQNLVFIAEATGGTAILNSNDYLGGIRRIASPPEYRYILGFAPHDIAADGKFHAVAIKLTNPADKGYTVQARRGYYAPKEGEGLPEAAAKEIENAVFSRDDIRDLPVEMRTEVKKAEGDGGELTVSTDIDLKLLHYRKADGRNCQELTAVAAVFDRDGNFVVGKQQTLTLKLRDETMDGLGQKPPGTLQSSFALSPGTYLVRLVVRSAEDQTMTEVSTQVDVR